MTVSQRQRTFIRTGAWFAATLILILAVVGVPRIFAHAATVITEPTGVSVSVDPSKGSYTITTTMPSWTFGGSVGHTLTNVAITSGSDNIGSYKEITFNWQGSVARSGGIRTYASSANVLFTTQYLAAASNAEAFPTLTTYPNNPYHLSYQNQAFGVYTLTWNSGRTAPWLSYDGSDNAFLISPATNDLTAALVKNADSSISSGIDTGISSLPQNFTHKTMLTIGAGINNVYTTWGSAMTALTGKTRVANDADVSLNTLGYWTDNGAVYYYNYDSSKGYEGTLEAVKSDFATKGIPLGYMQLDSWWYPKGAANTWQGDPNNARGGENTYTAAPALFPDGLSHFQQTLGLPLITHARWIDPASPYRQQYTMSNNVVVDPTFWSSIIGYIHSGGVMTYEQDWLSGPATSNFNLTDPYSFLNDMASAAKTAGLTLQYCMPTPSDYLQGSNYSNLTTMRVSNDRFESSKWNQFLYDSRLGESMNIWPWTDVYMSTEATNLLLGTLSGGMVGVGDAIGNESKTNLLQSVRPDGVIVKPDSSIIPTDETYINDAKSNGSAMVAYTYTDHSNLRDANVFAYSRSTTANQTATFSLNELGIPTAAYVYNYFTDTGTVVNAGGSFTNSVSSNGSYYVVSPIQGSGVALIGDAGKFVSAGHKRISHLQDTGTTIQATVAFANGEGAVTLHGYAPSAPTVAASSGTVGGVSYNSSTHLFSFTASQGSGNAANITITPGTSTLTTISNLAVTDTANAANWSIQSDIQAGNAQYGDRTITLTSVPSTLTGANWIRTADSSKLATNSPLVTFTINQAASVYVAVDTRLGKRSWMDASWTDTGTNLTNNESPSKTFELFVKTFPAGTVSLGPNAAGTNQSDNYTIIIQ